MVDPGNQWIQHVETKAVKTETLVFSVEANTSTEERSGKVIIMPPMGMGMPANYVIVQEGMSDTPPVVTGGGSADLETMNNGNAGRQYSTYTTANGWVAENSKVTSISSYFPELTARLPNLPASQYYLGVLSSPELSGGCGTLNIKWTRSSAASGNQLLVEIKSLEGTVLKSETYVNAETEQWTMMETAFDMNVAGDFKIVISNQNYVANDSADGIIQADDINVIAVNWTGYSE